MMSKKDYIHKGKLDRSSELSTKSSDMEDEVPIFKDLYISAFSKALRISDSANHIGSESSVNKETLEKSGNITTHIKIKRRGEKIGNHDTNSSLNVIYNHGSVIQSSTPKSSPKPKIDYDFGASPASTDNSSLDESFSPTKLLYECDVQRRLECESAIKERIKKMNDTDKLIQDSLEHLKQTRQEEIITKRVLSEQKILDDIHEQEIRNRPKREAQLAHENLKNAQRVQERNQKVREAEEEAKKKSEAILRKRKQLDKILEWQKEYGKEYKDMLETIKSCKDKNALTEITNSQSKLLKSCAAGCESLIKKCKQGDVTEIDIEYASKLVETVKMIHQYFASEIQRINDAVEESKKKNPQEVSLSLANDKEVVLSIQVGDRNGQVRQDQVNQTYNGQTVANDGDSGKGDSVASSDLSDCFDAQSLKKFLSLRTYLEDFEKSYQPIMEDDSTKKFRFNCQKAVTIPVNAISPVSGAHLTDKYVKLHDLLSGKMVEVGDVRVSASQHPLGIAYCKNLLAKKFVRQGNLTVSSKPDAAFSIAAVLASLWVDFPDFGQLVLAHFQLECPYLAPVFMPQVDGQSDEAYYKSLGYHYTPNGEVEKQDSFLKRMTGIMRLYAALIISKVRQPGRANPLGLAEGWRWMSAILNLEPRPDICATLLYDFLEVAGCEMFKTYGVQFKKMLAYICQEYFPKLEKVTPASSGGPIVRLEGFLQKVLKEESIPSPQGMLPANFWR